MLESATICDTQLALSLPLLRADPSTDVWQFGIVLFVCLTGCLPWQKACSEDPRYMRYLVWQGSIMMMPLRRTPKLFKVEEELYTIL